MKYVVVLFLFFLFSCSDDSGKDGLDMLNNGTNPDNDSDIDTLEEELPPALEFSHEPGFYESAFELTITSIEGNYRIIYTIDGSTPDLNNLAGTTFEYKNRFPGGALESSSFTSLEYTGPITIQDRSSEPEDMASYASDYDGYRVSSSIGRLFKGTVVRAVAIIEDGTMSREVTKSYFVSPEGRSRYSLPVISIATTSEHFFGYEEGIYTPGLVWDEEARGVKNGGAPANYNQRGREWERYAHLEMFENQETGAALSQNIGLRIHGGWSRAHAMKSLRIYARQSYGNEYVNHRVFPELPYDSYKRLILRNSGNDWFHTLFRDAAIQAVMSPLKVDIQAYRPIVLFINAEYWGIHNIRERYDKHYLARTYGVSSRNVDLLTNEDTVKEGTATHYHAMLDYLRNNDISASNHYEYIKTQMDVENFIDFQIAHIYSRNTDWPGNNIDFWRYREPQYRPDAPYGHDGRWRWMVFDTDFGFGIWENEASHNTLAFATREGVRDWPNPDWSTFVLRTLLGNVEFRNQFINRFADLINTAFLPERAISIIQSMQDVIAPEMQEHISRWNRPRYMSDWYDEVEKMIEFVNQRPDYQRSHIESHFDLAGTFRLDVDVSDSAGGYVRVNTIDLLSSTEGVSNPYPWTGRYFMGVPIEIEAVPNDGYTFSHWEGVSETSPVIRQTFTQSPVSIVAHFR